MSKTAKTAEASAQSAKSKKTEKTAVPAVAKALDVIELLAGSPEGLTMNEIVDALGRTMGEIYRVVVYLADRGYLFQDKHTNKYSLTLRLFELSHRHDPTERLIQAALPLLEDIAARTVQSCHLGVLNGDQVLVLASVRSPRPAGYAVRTGATFPVERTSSGHVVLAYSSPEVQDAYIRAQDALPEAELRDRLSTIRANGHEDTPSTMVMGVRNLCVPVFDSSGVVATITCGFIEQADTPTTAEESLTMIRTAALELSKSLGFISQEDNQTTAGA
ncbi:IclR family transcriptional regulator [Celeribacter sp.]|uniref:IclR family transcriptional regulator n=1 Tax=Celeribacter sp. TaxID=1890673 RepID=UPI003A93A0DF